MTTHQEHRILIVDDSFRNLNLMQKLLTSWGYSDCSVNNTEHTLNRLEQDHFDLIIVDKVFSSIRELDLAHKIRAIQPDTPVICSAEEYMSSPAVSKPKSPFRPFHTLKSLLKKVVENRESYDIVMI